MLCAITIMSSADLRSLNIYMVCGCMRMSSICVCVLGALVSGRSVCELTNRPSTDKSTKHTVWWCGCSHTTKLTTPMYFN